MNRIHLFIAAILMVLTAPTAALANSPDIPKSKQTELGLYLSPQQAWNMIQENPDETLFIDVRTRAEAMYVGVPEAIDALVPFAEHDPDWPWDDKRQAYKLEPAQGFVAEVNRRLSDKSLSKDAPVIVICRSGTRSARAADRLAQDGYTNVYSVVEGFEGDTSKSAQDKGQRTVNGWKNAQLPWTYKLQKEKMYLEEAELPSAN